MDRNKRFRQKMIAKNRLIRKIYEDMSQTERAGGWFSDGEWYPYFSEKRNRLNSFWKDWAKPVDYGSCPGWWNRLHHIRPSRRKAVKLANDVVKGVDSDVIDWPLARRPVEYYY